MKIETSTEAKAPSDDADKLARNKALLSEITSALASGGAVFMATYTVVRQYNQKWHAKLFKLGPSGSLYVRRGRTAWDCADYCAFRIFSAEDYRAARAAQAEAKKRKKRA